MRVKPMFAFALALLLTLPCKSQEDDEEGDEGDDPEADEGRGLRDGEPMNAESLKSLHAKIDSNGDGKVTLAELLAHPEGINRAAAEKGIDEVFTQADADKDGKVTLEEYLNDLPMSHMADETENPEQHKEEKAEYHKMETAKFKAADMDGNGLLNTTEMMGIIYPHTHAGVLHVTASETLSQKDADRDGALTKHEFWEPQPGEDGTPGKVEDDQHKDFEELDRNGDGKIDLEELTFFESGQFQEEQSINRFFKAADTNNDGHISSEEMAVSLDNSEDPDAHSFLGDWMDHHEL